MKRSIVDAGIFFDGILWTRFTEKKNDLGKLGQIFGQVQKGGARAVLVSGPAGAGKTCLLTRFAVEIESAGALFAYGKADTLYRSSPFSTLTAAMNMMVKKAIAEDPHNRKKLEKAFEKSPDPDPGSVLALVPAFSYVLGDVRAADRRPERRDNPSTNYRLLSLLEMLHATLQRPLFIFLDDLQWMDKASHGFLRYFAVNGLLPNTLLAMAFRSGYPDTSDTLRKTLFHYQNLETCLSLALSGLTKRDTRGWLKQRLHTDQNLPPLADLCHEKTAGNPFYLTRLLNELLAKAVIRRDHGEWVYDISYIADLGFSENVADLLIGRMKSLEADCLALLKQAACIHSGISISLLEVTSGFSSEKIETLLWRPIRENLLNKSQDGFAFAHDRILESVEAMLGEEEAREIHRRLADHYLGQVQNSAAGKPLFTLLYHYSFYSHTITDDALRITMAGLYYGAGEIARSRSSHDLALGYFIKGQHHFPGDIWAGDYELALKFCRQIAECAYLTGDFSVVDAVFAEVQERALSFSDRLDVEMVKIPCFHAQGKNDLAMDAGLAILRHLNIRIARKPSRPEILYYIAKAWLRFILYSKTNQKQQLSPDADVFKAVQCLNDLGPVAYCLSPGELLPVIAATALNLGLKYRYISQLPTCFIAFGIILNSMTGTLKWGIRLGGMAREIHRNFSDDRLKTKELTLFHSFIDHWNNPLSESRRNIETLERLCLRQGDHESFGFNAIGGLYCLLMDAAPICDLLKTIRAKKDVTERINNQFALTVIRFMEQAVANLAQGVARPWILRGDHFDESLLDTQNNGILVDFYFCKFCMAFYCGRTDVALEIKKDLEPHIELETSTLPYFYFFFLSSLLDIQMKAKPRKIKRRLKNLKRYASYNGAVYQSKYLLVRGGYLKLKGDGDGAGAAYRDAATSAEENRLSVEQALAFEGLGRLAEDNGDEAAAKGHFSRAITLYKTWGLKWKNGLFGDVREEAFVLNHEAMAAAGPVAGPAARRGEGAVSATVEDSLRTMKGISGASVIHAAVQISQSWKSLIYIDDKGVHRPATYVPVPEKLFAFACTTREVLRVDTGMDSIEAHFFDTAYFWENRPSSLMVIPGGERTGVYIENFNPASDMLHLTRLAEQVLAKLAPHPPGKNGLPTPENADTTRIKDNCARVKAYMAMERAYTNPNLSLEYLAQRLKLPERSITDAINTCLGQNFRTFVNSYRIEAAKQAFHDPKQKNRTILEIAYASGFNSKSTFNHVFKELVGTTPSRYRTENRVDQKDEDYA